MFSLIGMIVIIYLAVGVVLNYIKREDKTNGFKLTTQDIKPILLWYTLFIKKDNSIDLISKS